MNGYYDVVRSSYDLGPGFKKDLHTKDILCSMCEFWIDPAGKLWSIDFSNTQDYELGDHTFKFVRNGVHGRVSPYLFDGSIEVYPAKWPVYYAATPSCQVTFVGGIIVAVEPNCNGSTN